MVTVTRSRPFERRLLPSLSPKTLIAAPPPPRLRSPSELSAVSSPPTHWFLRRFSAPGRPVFSGFREMLARAEEDKRRWGIARRMSGEVVEEEEDDGEEVGMEAVVERFERLADGWGGGSEEGEVESGGMEGGAEEEGERLDIEQALERYRMLLERCAKAETPDDVHNWMARIDKFEGKYLSVLFKCRNGWNMLGAWNVASEEEKPILVRKMVHMVELNQWRDRCRDSIIMSKYTEGKTGFFDALRNIGFSSEKKPSNSLSIRGQRENDRRQKIGNDTELLQTLHDIDKMIEEKLASCNQSQIHCEKKDTNIKNKVLDVGRTFQELKSCSFNHKGFDVKLIDVDRKYGKLKTGRTVKYIVLMACGNYNGVIGFARAEAPDFQSAVYKAYEECFQNLHCVGRHEDRTICHPVYAEHGKTKIYVWPASMGKGIKASRTVETVLRLAGFMDIRSKVIGCRIPQYSIIVLLKALSATRIPKDILGHIN